MGLNSLACSILLNCIKDYENKKCQYARGRKKRLSTEYIVDRIMQVLVTGSQWSHLEVNGGSWKTVYHYFSEWSRAKLFEKAYVHLLNVYSKRRPSSALIVDTSFIKNVFGRNCVGPSPFDRGRNATKVSVIVDESGIPLVFSFHPGNKNDSRTLYHTLKRCPLDIRDRALFADKIYDTEHCRSVLCKFGLHNCVSKKKSPVSPSSNKTRIVVEHAFSWLDKFRRILVRYEACVSKLRSFHYLASLQLTGKRLLRDEGI